MWTDVHQHLLPEPLIAALARRRTTPRLARDGAARTLHLAAEPPPSFDPADHDPVDRARLAEQDGVERVLVALSTALGVDALPADEAAPLLEAFNLGVLELGDPFALWAAVPLDAPSPGAAGALLDAGAAGVTLPAGALGSQGGLERVAPLLDRLEARDAPLFVHPGPASTARDAPAWWPALTAYVAEMSAAWHGFAAWG